HARCRLFAQPGRPPPPAGRARPRRGRGGGLALPRTRQPSRLEPPPPVLDTVRAFPDAGALAHAVRCEWRPPALRPTADPARALRARDGPRLRALLRKPFHSVS